MIRLLPRVTLLIVFFTVIIGGIRVIMPGDDPFAKRLAALDPAKCPMPCWLGIRPGVTTMREAVLIALNSPFLDPKSIAPLKNGENDTSFQVRWRAPAQMLTQTRLDTLDLAIDIESDATGKVYDIFMHINIPIGAFIRHFGPPPIASFSTLTSDKIFYVLEYPAWGMQYSTYLECRRDQPIAVAQGQIYVLQSLATYVANTGERHDIGWHGFTSHALNAAAAQVGCP